MQLTEEQIAILKSEGDIKINAVAGSGKTTTMIEYARSRPQGSKILYLAFNKTVKIEAQDKFTAKGLKNLRVETAHSLAYRHIVPVNGYVIKHQGYKLHELAELLGLTGNGEKHAEYILASHIGKFLAYYCNSDKGSISDLNYLDMVHDRKARLFVKNAYKYIEQKAVDLFHKMERKEIDATHDFYLKKFQLSHPTLNYDYILFDEGQDASAAMLDIFLGQKACKIIVGDTHQQIYGWRFAVNSLQKVNFPAFHLSGSFRFGVHIAGLANKVLGLKSYLNEKPEISITGKGDGAEREGKSKTIIARTNLGLLLKAISYVTSDEVKKLYFEGNINSYTYADDGASLYDVLNLYNQKRSYIRDKLISAMNSLEELEDYVKKTEDVQLGMLVDIVKEYGNSIPGIIRKIKDRHVEDKREAEIIFSTVHRCKGMEYDEVELVNDFISEQRLEKLLNDKKGDHNLVKYAEEINLLYVAVTRSKRILRIPEDLLPRDFKASEHIYIIQMPSDPVDIADDNFPNAVAINNPPKEKAYSVEKVRETFKKAYSQWTMELDLELGRMKAGGISTKELAEHFGRTQSAIRSRLKKLLPEELAT
jgi:superfamily I DNA/RNA helicase